MLEHDDPLLYELYADESVVRPESFAAVSKLEEAALSILRKYLEKFYRVEQQRWESQHMVMQPLDGDDPNFQDYTIKISRSEEALLNAVNDLIEEGERIYEAETRDLPNIHFDRHLYQPLLVERDERIVSKPEGLKKSEEEFVEKLRAYCVAEAESALAGKEVFLLRNLTRGKGVGFFENEGFFPDFILWVKEGQHQRIVFVEPHGMRHEKAYWSSDKLKLHERLQEFSEKLHERGQLEDVELDSYIISATKYDELRSFYGEEEWSRDDFAEKHILFKEDEYVGCLF